MGVVPKTRKQTTSFELCSKVFDFVFGCHHGHLSGVLRNGAHIYRVCCDCGTRFDYSLASAQLGMVSQEKLMRKTILFVLLCVIGLWAQDKAQITVKNAETNSGIVFVTAVQNGKQLELQCTAQQAWCA